MNAQRSLIRELMLYDFEQCHNGATEASKKICRAKGEDAVDHSIVTRWLKKFRKNIEDLPRPGRPKK